MCNKCSCGEIKLTIGITPDDVVMFDELQTDSVPFTWVFKINGGKDIAVTFRKED